MELTILCKELNNWFDVKKHFGTFVIEDGELKTDVGLKENQYFRIVGSIFNDGIYKFPNSNLKNEEFDGAIWLLAIPHDVIALCDKISDWEEKNQGAILSPFSSESFGGYSYTKADITSGNSGSKNALNAIFGAELNRWRKV